MAPTLRSHVTEQSALTEKPEEWIQARDERGINPVIESAEFALKATNLVEVNNDGVKSAAEYIHQRLLDESYTPRTWRTHPLHICPPEPYAPDDPLTKAALNWLFLVSALNFSFWSEREGHPDRYGVEWRSGWSAETTEVWTGYWSLVAALDRALEENIPITDPMFYSSETLCPDSLIEYVFRPAHQSSETMPLLKERISIMREVGFILCASFGGSFQGFLEEFWRRKNNEGTALDLVRMVTDTFPSFQDETWYEGRRVYLWKRAQILVAESWAAFYPAQASSRHPLFPGPVGPLITQLTMFADYRVPQILHHLRVLVYAPSLVAALRKGTSLASGSREELAVRAASIVAVEQVREEITRLQTAKEEGVSSVLIDFYLWDLAKRVEREDGEEAAGLTRLLTAEILPAHRTRSIWY